MSKVLAAAVAVLTALSLAACGSSDASSTTATGSLKTDLIKQSAAGASPFTFSDAQAQCIASTVVKGVGAKQLQQYGLLDAKFAATPATLSQVTMSTKDATTTVNAIINCIGQDTFNRTLTDAIEKNITGADKQTQRTCLESKLTATELGSLQIAVLSGDTTTQQKVGADILSCVPSAGTTP